MLDCIKFKINKWDLVNALEFLKPFIVEKDDESEMILPQPYFYDKVTFLLYKTHAFLSVITKEGAWIERTCDIESNVEEEAFCIPLTRLLLQVDKYHAQNYTFIEDRFFGFSVGDSESGRLLFEVDAHSISKHPSIHPKFHYKNYYEFEGLEFDTLIKVLKEFPKYTTDWGLRPYAEYIWFYIYDGTCRVVACSGSQMRQEIFPTEAKFHKFSLLGKFAGRVLDNIVDHEDYYACDQIGYGNGCICFYKISSNGRYEEIIELPACKTELPSLERTLLKRNIKYRSYVNLKDLQSALRTINVMDYKEDYVLMHFFNNHVNLYHGDSFSENRFFLYIDAYGYGEYTVKLHKKILEAVLEEIHTDDVRLLFVDDNLLYINNVDEEPFGNVIRILWTIKLQDNDMALMDRGDNYLNSHKGYIEKYLSEPNNEEESPEVEFTPTDEMKEEALLRMREVIDDSDVIDSFEETGLPQVYIHPHGGSYSLEDDELEKVRDFERSHQVLVWGVIRSKISYNWQDVTVDCMLHVSQNKDEWDREREDLLNGIPFVYTVMKEYPVTDHGHINVYKSEAGTLLRR